MSQSLAQITPQDKPSALRVMADRMNVDSDKLLATLKATVFKGASNEELLSLVVVANTYGLSPLLKEIYAFPAKGGGIVPVVSIDGWLRMANDHPQMDGIETSYETNDQGGLLSCTCKIYRKDRKHPTVATEYLSECKRNTEPWKMEHRMLRHKAIIQCSRIAFGFSGIHDEDEGRDISERTVQGREIKPATARLVPLDPFTRPAALPGAPKSATVHSDSVLDGLNANDFSQDEYLAAMIYLKISSAQDFGQISEGEHKLALERWEEIEGEIMERRAA